MLKFGENIVLQPQSELPVHFLVAQNRHGKMEQKLCIAQ